LLIFEMRTELRSMMEEAEARARVLAGIRPLPSRRASMAEALNCFAAQQYLARVPLPGFDNSAMDGYAVSNSDRANGKRLRVIGEQPAGPDRALRVAAGEAVRIFTGAPIPQGAAAVIMQEDVTREGEFVTLNTDVGEGEFIRRQACDLAEGQEILPKGSRIRPTTAALLASQGLTEVEVGGAVSAAVVSTGDEIVAPGNEIGAGQIYDSNSVLLSTLLRQTGAEVAFARHSPDNIDALKTSIGEGARHQVLVVTGGVSVGEHDLVQTVVRALGGTIDGWRVALKPGKPFLFGRIGDCALFGLPGNPVSAFVTFLKFVRPAILKMMGANQAEQALRRVRARLIEGLKNEGDRAHYIRGRYDEGVFTPTGRQESHALFGLSRSNAMLRLAAGQQVEAEAVLEVELWD
jgi:molybdopterin molybdotransferase